MEGLAPTPLVDVGDQIVEGVDEIWNLLGLLDLLWAAEEGPVLLVVVLDFLRGDRAAGEIDGAFALLLGRAENPDEPVEAAG